MPLHPVEEIGEGRGDRQGHQRCSENATRSSAWSTGLEGNKASGGWNPNGTPTESLEALETAASSTVSIFA